MTSLQRAIRGAKNDWHLHLLSVFSVAVAFVCLVSAALVVVNIDALQTRWSTSGRASIYLEGGVLEKDVRSIERALLATEGVRSVRFVSSEEARRELVEGLDDELLTALPLEAFPASLEAELSGNEASRRLEQLRLQLETLPQVEAVETYGSWTSRLKELLAGALMAAGVLLLVVLFAVTSVVSSTMRLTLQRRKIEVEVLKLVGATDGYVRRPFVLEGAAQGAVGSLLAIGIVLFLYLILQSHFDTGLGLLVGLSPRFLPWHWLLGLLLLGGLLGSGAAHLSLRRLLVEA